VPRHSLIKGLNDRLTVQIAPTCDLKRFVRVRPMRPHEERSGATVAVMMPADGVVSVSLPNDDEGKVWDTREFSGFDGIFMPGDQKTVFNECADLVKGLFHGVNGAIFAYGQTGAGKTHSMFGFNDEAGIIPQACQLIFDEVCAQDTLEVCVTASMLGVYYNSLTQYSNDGTPPGGNLPPEKRNLKVRINKSGEVEIPDMTEIECQSASDLLQVVEDGLLRQSVRLTNVSASPSYGHTLVMIKVRTTCKRTREQRTGKLVMCDLAGSERRKAPPSPICIARNEAMEIHKSLTSLHDVIKAQTTGAKFVPWRNHKLTHVLQDVMNSTSKVIAVIACSPASSNAEETYSSICWAWRLGGTVQRATAKK